MNAQQVAGMVRKNADVIAGIKSAHGQQPKFISEEKAVAAGTLSVNGAMIGMLNIATRTFNIRSASSGSWAT